jgi:hypothetical protein
MFNPSEGDLTIALREGRKCGDYTWGTFWFTSPSGAYVAFAWKAWLGAVGVVMLIIFILSTFSK